MLREMEQSGCYYNLFLFWDAENAGGDILQLK